MHGIVGADRMHGIVGKTECMALWGRQNAWHCGEDRMHGIVGKEVRVMVRAIEHDCVISGRFWAYFEAP